MDKTDKIYLFGMALGFLIGALFSGGAYKAGIRREDTFLIDGAYYSCKADKK